MNTRYNNGNTNNLKERVTKKETWAYTAEHLEQINLQNHTIKTMLSLVYQVVHNCNYQQKSQTVFTKTKTLIDILYYLKQMTQLIVGIC